MPELPEVETIVRELNAVLPGKTIRDVRVFRDNALGGTPAADFRRNLLERRITEVTRQGKFLQFALHPTAYLVAHLRMTGKFILSGPLAEPGSHHRVWFILDDGSLLVFQDMRCFGTLTVVERLEDHLSLQALGVDPLAREFTADWLGEALTASRSPLKHWLMNQSNIAGLGNIYAAEILYRAKISPLRPANALTGEEPRRLHREVRKVLQAAVRKNGTTISDFQRVDEKSGQFQNFLRVYGKEGEPCPSCREPILRIRQQQRSTFYCPSCQT